MTLELRGPEPLSSVSASPHRARLRRERSPSPVLMLTCTCFKIWPILPQTTSPSVSASETRADNSTSLPRQEWGVKGRGLRHSECCIHTMPPRSQGAAFLNASHTPIQVQVTYPPSDVEGIWTHFQDYL